MSLGPKPIITGRNEVVAKVIFLHLSVILFTGGRVSASVHAGIATPEQTHSPRADMPPPRATTPPLSRHPKADTPHPPGQTHPRADTPQEQTPPRSRHPQGRHPLEQTHPPEQTPSWSRHPQEQTPPGADTPRSRHPQEQTPPWEADSGIQSMSGRYASYWNAFLFGKIFAKNCMKIKEIGTRVGARVFSVPPPADPSMICCTDSGLLVITDRK